MAAKVAKLAALSSGLPFACFTVYAATEKASKSQLVKPDQLSVYRPPPLKLKFIEEQPGYLEKQISSGRQKVGPYIEWCKDAFLCVKNGIMDSIQFGKGSRWKKIVYPLGLIASGISVCYPAQSVVFAKPQQESVSVTQEDKKKKEISSPKPVSAFDSRSFNRAESSPVESWSNEDPVPSSGTVKTSKFKPCPKLMDHGQSSPEDVDMYSTRS
ncbi:apolipoprotein O-like protein [Amazona aestiva]|uniref:Apolipoprotein O-like protein n=1 Tax=Amazona aestiva TaxID=12930 RepID=A0A0Q3MMG1_AMAAE|nr:apolipoprotein O-like protein [Amazona aestiva]